MNADNPDEEDTVEQFTETRIESLEEEYIYGSLRFINVKATWRDGMRSAEGVTPSWEELDASYALNTRFKVSDGTAELDGFYPETSKTGKGLWRNTLRSIRAMHDVATVVEERLDDEITVISPKATLKDEFEEGE